jgi:molybdenum cofactor biosynthesis enzyme MoaA
VVNGAVLGPEDEMLTTIEGLMSPLTSSKPIRLIRDHLYIEPISVCNLKCKMCYANVINGADRRMLDKEVVLSFAERFMALTPGQAWVLWCGTGEIYLHRDFPAMVNHLMAEFPDDRLQHTIQTNGTVRRWREFDCVPRLDVCVSIDGWKQFHEWHRGKNTYDRTLAVCHEAVDLGCRSLQVRCLLTRDNIEYLDEFRDDLTNRISPRVALALATVYGNRELAPMRQSAPSIVQHDIDDSPIISTAEAREILEHKYQNRYELEDDSDTVDNYMSLTTYGTFTCCNGAINIGEPSLDMPTLINRRVGAALAICFRASSAFRRAGLGAASSRRRAAPSAGVYLAGRNSALNGGGGASGEIDSVWSGRCRLPIWPETSLRQPPSGG